MKEFAEQAERAQRGAEEKTDAKLDVTTMVEKAPEPEAVAEEAKKGYDLMIIGLEKTVARRNEFHDDVTTLAAGFEGPLAVADARDQHLEEPLARQAQYSGAGQRHRRVAARRRSRHRHCARQQGAADRALCRDWRQEASARASPKKPSSRTSSTLAESYQLELRTAVRAECAPEEAILKESVRLRHNLVVMGVGRRPGEKLFFGDTAAALLGKIRTLAAVRGELVLVAFRTAPPRRGARAEGVAARETVRRDAAGIGAVAAPIGEFLDRRVKVRPGPVDPGQPLFRRERS